MNQPILFPFGIRFGPLHIHVIFEMGRELTTPLLDGEGAHAPMGVKVFLLSLAALMRLQMDPFDRRNEGDAAKKN